MKIVSMEPVTVHVSRKTKWFFVKMVSDDGLTGYGEATLFGWEPLLRNFLEIAGSRVLNREIDSISDIVDSFPDRSGGRVSDSIVSAMEMAYWDILGQKLGQPLHALWGTTRAAATFYANINRGTLDRSPQGWVQRARAAEKAGFKAIKMAPFDGLRIVGKPTSRDRKLVEAALEKIAAVAEALDDETMVMIDCHWRLDPGTALYVLREIASFGAGWLEAPIPERFQTIEALSALNAQAARADVILAGAEMQYGGFEYEPYLSNKAFAVVMPDLRWCGGITEGLRIAAMAQEHGVRIAPHNSAGPVLGAASLHFVCAIGNLHAVEIQFDESPLYFSILRENGAAIGSPHAAAPETAGLGISLDEELIAASPAGESDWSQVFGEPGSSAYS